MDETSVARRADFPRLSKTLIISTSIIEFALGRGGGGGCDGGL